MTLYSCADVGPLITFHEIVFASRQTSISTEALTTLESTAKGLGVTWKEGDLKRVNHTGCPNNPQ